MIIYNMYENVCMYVIYALFLVYEKNNTKHNTFTLFGKHKCCVAKTSSLDHMMGDVKHLVVEKQKQIGFVSVWAVWKIQTPEYCIVGTKKVIKVIMW